MVIRRSNVRTTSPGSDLVTTCDIAKWQSLCTTHASDKQFLGPKCMQEFTTQTDLNRHWREEDGTTRYTCDMCGILIKEKIDLKAHMDGHTGEKSYQCAECGNCYRHRSSLCKHKIERGVERWRVRFLSSLASGLRSQQRSGQYCDVTIKVEGVAFNCHKAVLCAVSPYFTAMFAHDMKEARDSVVDLHETKPEMFDLLLSCIYDGEDIITPENIQDVLEIASLMQIDMLLEQIESYFHESISVDNFVDIWYMAKKYHCQRLEKFIWTFMMDNFVALNDSGDLSLLPIDTFEAFMGDETLFAQSEDLICDAALQWIAADKESRLSLAPRLISKMRLPLCSAEYIMQKFNNEPIVHDLPEAKLAINQALQFKMYPARKQDYTAKQTTYRKSSRMDDVMVVIGGTDTSEYSGSGVRCYSFQREIWFDLPPLPQNVGPHYALCTYADDIYVSGGQYCREAFHKFQASSCAWVALPKLPSGRFDHAMASVTDVVFVIGGDGSVATTTIYGFQTQTGSWESYCDLVERVNHAKAAVLGNNILILGGNNSGSLFSDTIQLFDPFRKQVSVMTSETLPGVSSQVVMFDTSAYTVEPSGSVVEINEELKSKQIGKICNFCPKRFSAVQYRGDLFITTGSQSTDNTSPTEAKVFQIDPANDMKLLKTIRIPKSKPSNEPWLATGTRLRCAKISIGKLYLKHLDEG
ncbi:kelch-like protein 6 [Mya arenaria]|uniref:kelch-like protein 6 n=1 Tax=Mya arenaria TaxID=6604 RepID=UPI0022E3C95D|nr:kelch-like protein 6 [Mya arenaria]